MKTKVEHLVLTCFSFFALLLICIPSMGQAAWSGIIQVTGFGSEAQGAGLSIYDINGDGKNDMVLMAYDNPAGLNYFSYKIEWDFLPTPVDIYEILPPNTSTTPTTPQVPKPPGL